jgi:TetR/AcrR family transcriptional regulator
MSEFKRERGEATRRAILNAAESVFAEQGFDGARIDHIADLSGYNKTLIFRYFGDKVGLYEAVLKRMSNQTNELQEQLLGPLVADEMLITDRHQFKSLLTTVIGMLFDYLAERPQMMRMIIWEHAQGWQTYAKMDSLFREEELHYLTSLLARAQETGLIRSEGDPLILLLLAQQICWSYLTSLPLYQMVLPQRDFSSAVALAHAREQIISFIVAGLLGESSAGFL